MNKGRITYADVCSAIQELQQEGESPTIQKVRDWLGRGSFSTISEHLKSWRAEQQQAGPIQQASQQVPPVLMQLVQEIWRSACNQADVQLDEHKQQAQSLIDTANTEREAAFNEVELVGQKNQLLESKNAQLLTEIQTVSAQISRLETQLEASQATQQEMKATLYQAEKNLQRQAEEFEQRLTDQAHNFAQQLQQEQQRNEANQERWLQEVDLARQQVQQLKIAAQEDKQAYLAEVKSLEEELFSNQQIQQQAQLNLEQVKQGFKSLEESNLKLTDKKHKLEQELKQLTSSLEQEKVLKEAAYLKTQQLEEQLNKHHATLLSKLEENSRQTSLQQQSLIALQNALTQLQDTNKIKQTKKVN